MELEFPAVGWSCMQNMKIGLLCNLNLDSLYGLVKLKTHYLLLVYVARLWVFITCYETVVIRIVHQLVFLRVCLLVLIHHIL